jgi:phosphohistidine phosphatase
MTQVLFMRHGIAVDLGEQGIRRDADRPLSARGIQRTREVADALVRLGLSLDVIGASPLVRAEQTAALIKEAFGKKTRLETCAFMSPGGAARDMLAWLKKHKEQTLLLVGHMPDLARLTSGLLTGGPVIDLAFKKAGIAALEFDSEPDMGNARLAWLMQPKHLCTLNKRTRPSDD